MAFELATYGALAGLLHKLFPRKRPFVYLSLLISMIAGRLVWGAAMFVCMGISGKGFPFSAFLAGAVTNALPGIALQLILIPVLVVLIEKPRTFPPRSVRD